ncbi:MAG: dihydrodipicolinate synthase family protein [Deltaproteobacteria bacterium]|nr:dihydrodipicolinate synthase family protein [Deltaproteobacteria bacterium]
MELSGILAPVLTPFRDDGSVDEAALAREVDFTIEECHADAVEAAAVETQEYHYLSHEARRALIRTTARLVKGRRPLIVGVTHPDVKAAAELCHLAEDLGAAAAQALIPLRPFGGEPSTGEVLRYFETLGRGTSLPLVAYCNPGPGANAPVPMMVALAKLECVQYFKESSRDLRRVGRLIEEIDRAGHARFFTTAEMLLITLMLGGPGATTPPPAVKIAAELLRCFRAGDLKAAAEHQRKFTLFPARWIHHGMCPVMKAAMRLAGVDVGDPHPPFEPLTAQEVAELREYLHGIGLTAR